MNDIDNIDNSKYNFFLGCITHSGEVEVYWCNNRSELDRLTLELFDGCRVVKQIRMARRR